METPVVPIVLEDTPQAHALIDLLVDVEARNVQREQPESAA